MGWEEIRGAAHEAAAAAAEVIERTSAADLDRPALGAWDVRGLAGHLLRAMRTPLVYLEEPAATRQSLSSAAEYYAAYLAWREPNPDRADDAVATRGAAELAHDSITQIQDAFQQARRDLQRLDAEPADRLLPTAFGAMRLADYMRTRIVEMVAHTLDLAAALDEEVPIPLPALADALALLTEVAIARGDGEVLLRELIGRHVDPSALPVLR